MNVSGISSLRESLETAIASQSIALINIPLLSTIVQRLELSQPDKLSPTPDLVDKLANIEHISKLLAKSIVNQPKSSASDSLNSLLIANIHAFHQYYQSIIIILNYLCSYPILSQNILPHIELDYFIPTLLSTIANIDKKINIIKQKDNIPGYEEISLDYLLIEKKELGLLAYLFLKQVEMDVDNVALVLNFLKDLDETDVTAPYILTGFLSLLNESANIDFRTFKAALVVLKLPWKQEDLKSLIIFKFSLFITGPGKRDPALFQQLSTGEFLTFFGEKSVENSISITNIFGIMKDRILSFKSKNLLNQPQSNNLVWNKIDLEFQETLTLEIQSIIELFLKSFGRLVRNLKNADEDQVATNSRQQSSVNTNNLPRNFELLLLLIEHIMLDRPDKGYLFWEKDLANFLRFGADVRNLSLKIAYYNMMAALSSGQKSSKKAFEFFSSHQKINFRVLFESIGSTVAHLNQNNEYEIDPTDVKMFKSFLKCFSNCLEWCFFARENIIRNYELRSLENLFGLLNSRIPTSLKSALFDAIASFISPLHSSTLNPPSSTLQTEDQINIAFFLKELGQNIFSLLDQSQILTIRNGTILREGLCFDLEERESVEQVYPETLAFLRLFKNLLLAESGSGGLGSGHEFYYTCIVYVIENVFLKIDNRSFFDLDEKLVIVYECLEIFSICLDLFKGTMLVFINDFETLKQDQQNQTSNTLTGDRRKSIDLSPIHLSPGFKILTLLLSGSTLTTTIFSLLQNSPKITETKNKNLEPPIFSALKLLFKVIKTQQTFLDTFIPFFHLLLPSPASHHTLCGIDQLLAFYKDVVIAICMLVSCPTNDRIVLLSLRLVGLISLSPSFQAATEFENLKGSKMSCSRLVQLLARSENGDMIKKGIIERVKYAEVFLGEEVVIDDERLVQGADGLEVGLGNSIRSAIVNIILSNLKACSEDRVTGFGHFLLGFDCLNPANNNNNNNALDLPLENGENCLDVIVGLLDQGFVSFLDGGDHEETIVSPEKLEVGFPVFSERCYQLVYMLAFDSLTSVPVLRFLRRSDFLFRQVSLTKVWGNGIGDVEGDEDGEEEPVDLGEIDKEKKLEALVSQLCRRGWLLKTLGLELHSSILNGQISYAQRIVGVLFLDDLNFGDNDSRFGGASANNMYSDFENPLTKVLEILNSVDFTDRPIEDMQERKNNGVVQLHAFEGCTFEQFLKRNERGCEIYDIFDIHAFLSQYSSTNEFEYRAQSLSIQKATVRTELSEILNHLLTENFKRQFWFAQTEIITGWLKLVSVSVTEGFKLFPIQIREEKILSLLANLFPKVIDESSRLELMELSSDVVLALVSKLKSVQSSIITDHAIDDRNEDAVGFVFPPEHLQQVVLKGILDGILRLGATMITRGNYYASLILYLQLTTSCDISGSSSAASLFQSSSSMTAGNSYLATLKVGNCGVIENIGGERLFDLVCRDACESGDVWKTLSLSLLSTLYELISWRNGPSHHRLLDFLVERNYIAHYILMMKSEDEGILSVLSNENVDSEVMNMVFVFEVKMTLFLRISRSVIGSDKLVQNNVLEAIRDFRFLDMRPDMDSSMDYDSFLPSANETYTQVLTPVLKLCASILSNSSQQNFQLFERVASIFLRHGEIFLSLLKSNSQSFSLSSLEELRLISFILSKLPSEIYSKRSLNSRFNMSDFIDPLILIMNRFTLPFEKLEKKLIFSSFKNESLSEDQLLTAKEEAMKLFDSICRNLFVLSIKLNEGEKFYPVIVWSNQTKEAEFKFSSPPTAQQFGNYLQALTARLTSTISKRKILNETITDIQTLSMDEITTICARSEDEITGRDIPTHERYTACRNQLIFEVDSCSMEISMLINTIESGVSIIWMFINHSSSESSSGMVSREVVGKLKADLLAGLDSTLEVLSKMEMPNDVGQNSESVEAFVQTLTRKIQE